MFHDGATANYYASQLEPCSPAPPRKELTADELHSALSALQLRHPSTSHLYSLHASRIQFVPYQFRPVLKLIEADRPRMLIADEVGVGKTIESGLLLKELQARGDIRSVLVICPKPLVAEHKWLEEMKRFDEQFVHLDGRALEYCINETHLDGEWPQQYARAILPYSLLDEALLHGRADGHFKRRGLLSLDPPPTFDLVIVDEAHHIRNSDTWAYRVVRYFCENAEAVVLLSATPIQLGDKDLFTLLNVLRPDLLPTPQAFQQMAEPNPSINEAIEAARAARPDWLDVARIAIERALGTAWGSSVLVPDPRVREVQARMAVPIDDPSQRLRLIRMLEDLYTFSPLINRTRRRDIGQFTTRTPETVAVEFTSEQRLLHDALLDLIARILSRRHGDGNVRFMMSMIQRQTSSCIFGLGPLLEAILNRHLSQLELSEMDDTEDPDEGVSDVLSDFRKEVEVLIVRARSLSGDDPKLDAFQKIIRDKQCLDNNKLLVFSTFRHTLAYLVARLVDTSVRIGLIHGDIPEDERRALRNRFSLSKEDPRAIDVLLSSEVGCEGLDYQFCDALVNYDLPWNPMRVEQRIGRIDRYGQKSSKVVVYNFVTPGTVDADIYERCLLRIGVFRSALGGSEEILGRITREIRNIAENLSLTPEEQAGRLQQLADNEIRTIQEQARLEDEQAKLFGLSLPQSDEQRVKDASSFWLLPAQLANLVEQYLKRMSSDRRVSGVGTKAVTTIQLGQDAKAKLLLDYQRLRLTGAVARQWERWLKGSDAYLALTFEPAVADQQRDVMFVTPTHPLARQAAIALEPFSAASCRLVATSNAVPAGRHPFAIYRWRTLGLKEDFRFEPTCDNPLLGEHLLELLAQADTDTRGTPITAGEEGRLEQIHHNCWQLARAGHIDRVASVAGSRLASLETTAAARIRLLEDQRDVATDARIRRMRESQIVSAARDRDSRAATLREAPTRADIVAEVALVGIIVIGATP